ncbi:hypothetical protein N826_21520 [Skermanella aerolata KACC 11604]|nr:hypothetical protein N826_21520 [Skermanella aerolata KACC 11604]
MIPSPFAFFRLGRSLLPPTLAELPLRCQPAAKRMFRTNSQGSAPELAEDVLVGIFG